uniref:Endo/exonuclease/phosphatase domain-containing protein n=1 Tax=Angiostrongylus cantonensis TaxID=6313 RepID=A0A0K0DF43_ANGCA
MRVALLFVPIFTLLGNCVSRRLRVMTFNIWQTGIRVSNGFQKIAKHIAFIDPDIVALQVYSSPALLSLLGHPWTVLTDEESKLDVAILTKHTVRPGTVAKTTHAIGGRIDLGFGVVVSMWSVHLDHKAYGPHAANNKMVTSVDQILVGEKLNNKAGRVQNIMEIFDDPQMKQWLNKSNEIPLILAGDFNTPSHIDWTEETSGKHGNWTVEWPVTKIVEAMGFIDSFRVVHPNVSEVPGYTWSTVYKFLPEWDFKIPEPQDRIDFIFYKGNVIVLDSFVYAGAEAIKPIPYHRENDYPSDHFAVVTEFEIEESEAQ